MKQYGFSDIDCPTGGNNCMWGRSPQHLDLARKMVSISEQMGAWIDVNKECKTINGGNLNVSQYY